MGAYKVYKVPWYFVEVFDTALENAGVAGLKSKLQNSLQKLAGFRLFALSESPKSIAEENLYASR